MNDEERIELEGLQACQWWLVPPQLDNAGCETVTLEKVLQRDGRFLYAIRKRGFVLNKRGRWEYEPNPSSRTDAFLQRCRFKTVPAALAAWAEEQA